MTAYLENPLQWLKEQVAQVPIPDVSKLVDSAPFEVENPPTQATCNSVARCGCNQILKANNPFSVKDRCDWTVQLSGSKPTSKIGRKWNADVYLDMNAGNITVTNKFKAINHTKYNSGVAGINTEMSDRVVAGHTTTVANGIKKWWNAKPYKIRIKPKGAKCPEKTYNIFFNPTFVTSGEHYTIYFYNIPITPQSDKTFHPELKKHGQIVESHRSFAGETRAYFNFGDPRSAIYNSIELEVHEYGHIIGLLDSYYRNDINPPYNGVRYFLKGDQDKSVIDDHISTEDTQHDGMMGGLSNPNHYYKGYALTVAKVIIRHLNEVWQMPVEEWEIVV